MAKGSGGARTLGGGGTRGGSFNDANGTPAYAIGGGWSGKVEIIWSERGKFDTTKGVKINLGKNRRLGATLTNAQWKRAYAIAKRQYPGAFSSLSNFKNSTSGGSFSKKLELLNVDSI